MPEISGIPHKLEGVEKRLDGHDVRFQRIEERVDAHGWRLDRLEAAMEILGRKVMLLVTMEQGRDPNFLNVLRAAGLAGGNPYDPKRRSDLIDKYAKGMMTLSEAKELKGYLEEDLVRVPEDTKAIILTAIIGVENLIDLTQRALERASQLAT